MITANELTKVSVENSADTILKYQNKIEKTLKEAASKGYFSTRFNSSGLDTSILKYVILNQLKELGFETEYDFGIFTISWSHAKIKQEKTVAKAKESINSKNSTVQDKERD